MAGAQGSPGGDLHNWIGRPQQQYQCSLRGRQVQSDNGLQLLGKLRVAADFEGHDLMRLEPVGPPHPAHAHLVAPAALAIRARLQSVALSGVEVVVKVTMRWASILAGRSLRGARPAANLPAPGSRSVGGCERSAGACIQPALGDCNVLLLAVGGPQDHLGSADLARRQGPATGPGVRSAPAFDFT